MRKEEKKQLIDSLTQQLQDNSNFYLTDVSTLNAEATSNLRRLCFKYDIKMQVVKNTLLKKAMESAERDYEQLYETLVGNTSILFAESGSAPAKLIKEFRKTTKQDRPILKGAFIEEMSYLGEEQLDFLT